MHRIRTIILSLTACLFLPTILAAPAASMSAIESEAGTVLLRYFSALTQGDTAALRSLMGGELLAKRSRLLDNPAYPGHLIQTYGQAHYTITKYSALDDTTVSIDAIITMSPEESINKRFLLKRKPDRI
ncbi:MAG: hypothetical protein IPK65_00495 [Gammaproteobacteria bacterium]|nr:hypothetical protein [Gammaproteobacteria bacterium]